MRKITIFAAAILLCLAAAADVSARGGGGGGGSRGAGGSGGFRGPASGPSRGNEFRGNDIRGNDFRGNDFRGGEWGAGGIGGFDVNNGPAGRSEEIGEGSNRGGNGADNGVRPQVIHPSELGNRAPSREGVQKFLDLPGGAAGRDGQNAAQHAAASRPNKNANTAENKAQRGDRYNEVNKQLANRNDDFRRMFNNDFWHNHPHDRYPFRGPWASWWGAPGWGALAGWTAFGWGDPVGYNYGDNVYYDDGTVYSDGEPVATSEEYAQQASDIASNVPETDPEKVDWMPLGVFAVSLDNAANGPEPTIFMQLAVSKEGIVAGTYVNTANNSNESLEGSVDRKSQRTAWTVVGQKWPVFEAGIYNLTEKTAPMLVHFADGQTQQRLLVRVDKPQGGDADEAKTAPAESK